MRLWARYHDRQLAMDAAAELVYPPGARIAPVHMLDHLFAQNRAWSERLRRSDPDFFARLSRQQTPKYLWIGCADSRVPANEIGGDAWDRSQSLAVHGWVYGLRDRLVRDLLTTVTGPDDAPQRYRAALSAL